MIPNCILTFSYRYFGIALPPVSVANRYWVGGSGDWNDITHWSKSPGGVPGASIPTTADNVHINNKSGFGSGGTITILNDGGLCNDFVANSGHTYTISSSQFLSCAGSMNLESGLTFEDVPILLENTRAGKTLKTAGVILPSLTAEGIGIKLLDNLNISTQLLIQCSGTFNANNHNVTAVDLQITSTSIVRPIVKMGSGVWTGNWELTEAPRTAITIIPEMSTINISNGASVFAGLGKTYYNLIIDSTGVEVDGSNIFNTLTCAAGAVIAFRINTVQTVQNFIAVGDISNAITLQGFTPE